MRLLGRLPCSWVGIAILGVLTLLAKSVEATVGIGVTPTQVSMEVRAGSSTSGMITVSNEGDVPLTMRAYAMERRKDENGLRFIAPGDPRVSPARWLRLQPETFSLAPGTAREVRWDVQVPPDATPGDHVAAAFFEYVPPTSPDASSTKMVVGGRVGTIMAIRVPGKVVADPRILSFGFARRTVVWRFPPVLGWRVKPLVFQLPWLPVANNPPVPLALVLQNRGNGLFQPQGEVALYDLFGRPAGTVRVQGAPIYPNDTSRVDIVWDGAPFVGLFRARLSLQSGAAGALERETWIGVFPWRQGLSLAAALFGITLLRRSWRAVRARTVQTAPERWALPASSVAPLAAPSPGALSGGLEPGVPPARSSFPPRRLRKGRPRRVGQGPYLSSRIHPGLDPVSVAPAQTDGREFMRMRLAPQGIAVSGHPGRISGAIPGELEGEAYREKVLKEALTAFRGKLLQLVEETDEVFQAVLSSEAISSASGRLPGSADGPKGGRRIGDDSGGR